MSQANVEITGGYQNFLSGGVVQGIASWNLQRQPASAEIRLFWFTRGKGTMDLNVVQTQKFENPKPSDQKNFSLRLPTSPYSFSGKLVSLVWALELVVEPGDVVERKEIAMSSTGYEVELGEVS
ncbi:MAG: hypothetical protein ACOY3I_01055 [Verrucomicrobiota bacterium]